MGLSNDLVSQFMNIAKDTEKTKKEETLQGTAKIITNTDGSKTTYVQIDGSELLTPAIRTADIENNERVTVLVKDHTATITGNVSSPAARTNAVQSLGEVVATKVSTIDFEAQTGRINDLVADNVDILGRLDADEAVIGTLDTTYATIDNLSAANADIDNLTSTYGQFVIATAENFTAANGRIDNLGSTYANIEFSNIGEAAMRKIFADSGIIKDIVVDGISITGELAGVTIRGDDIIANTIVADKLVVRGDDGIYYKLNTDGLDVVANEADQDETNSINGQIIMANSITATKIDVEDLVAFGATIGGFKIEDHSIYSGVKESINNTTAGIYADDEGQVALGDADNFIRYSKDEDDNYKLEISADSILFGANKKTIDQLEDSNAELKDELDLYKKYFTMSENGFSISDGLGNETAELLLDSGIISFKKNGEQKGYWDGDDFHTGNIIIDVTKRAQFGDFAFVPRSDGSLSFLKLSGTEVTE